MTGSIAVANAWGISIGILLAGYGLVEVPRALYKRSFLDDRPTRAYKRVAHVSRSLQEAHEDLKKVCKAVATTARVMPRRHELRWAMDIIESEVPDAETLRMDNNNNNNNNNNNGEDRPRRRLCMQQERVVVEEGRTGNERDGGDDGRRRRRRDVRLRLRFRERLSEVKKTIEAIFASVQTNTSAVRGSGGRRVPSRSDVSNE